MDKQWVSNVVMVNKPFLGIDGYWYDNYVYEDQGYWVASPRNSASVDIFLTDNDTFVHNSGANVNLYDLRTKKSKWGF